MNIYKWLNREKSRFFTIEVKDGTNNIDLDHHWGSCNTNHGGSKKVSLTSQEEVQGYIAKMMKRRRSRGYELITPLMG